jgi:hypothetical protein
MMLARKRWSQENMGNYGDLSCTTVVGRRGGRSQNFLSPLVTYDLPSRFTHPQELARNTVNDFSMYSNVLYVYADTYVY